MPSEREEVKPERHGRHSTLWINVIRIGLRGDLLEGLETFVVRVEKGMV
jgi:hypothetical protein